MASYVRLSLAFLVLLVAYQVYRIPVPESANQKTLLRFIFYTNRMTSYLLPWVAMTGLTTEAQLKNAIMDHTMQIIGTNLDDLVSVDREVDGVPVRVFTPKYFQGKLRGMVYFHGGGWTIGNPALHSQATATLARAGNMVVISVDYRRVPGFSKKDGFDDCVKVFQYVANNADEFFVDKNRIAIAGDSAGGNYAAGVSLYLRDQGFSPMPKIQMLIYPSVQVLDLDLPSYQQNAQGPYLDRREMSWYMSHVFGRSPALFDTFMENRHVPSDVRGKMAKTVLNTDRLPKEMLYSPYEKPAPKPVDPGVWNIVRETCFDPYEWPLMAEDHSLLPQAYIFTIQQDPLRDDGFLYAAKLRDDGVHVTHENCQFGWHGMINLADRLLDSQTVLREMASYLNKEL